MITPRNMADSAKTHIVTALLAALTAGNDVADIPIFRCPTDLTIVEVGIIPQSTTGVTPAGNNSVWLVEKSTTAIVTKTFSTAAALPTKGTYQSLGSLSNADRLEGDILTISVTNSSTAVTGATVVQVEYIPTEVV